MFCSRRENLWGSLLSCGRLSIGPARLRTRTAPVGNRRAGYHPGYHPAPQAEARAAGKSVPIAFRTTMGMKTKDLPKGASCVFEGACATDHGTKAIVAPLHVYHMEM